MYIVVAIVMITEGEKIPSWRPFFIIKKKENGLYLLLLLVNGASQMVKSYGSPRRCSTVDNIHKGWVQIKVNYVTHRIKKRQVCSAQTPYTQRINLYIVYVYVYSL